MGERCDRPSARRGRRLETQRSAISNIASNRHHLAALPRPPAHPPRPPTQSGKYDPGSANTYGYYGNPAAAGYFGSTYPKGGDLALQRGTLAQQVANNVQQRLATRVERFNSLTPYDF